VEISLSGEDRLLARSDRANNQQTTFRTNAETYAPNGNLAMLTVRYDEDMFGPYGG